jgi:hypothetical protein
MSNVNQNFDRLNFVDNLNDTFYINTVEDNLKSFLSHGLLNVGGFVNVNVAVTGLYNNSFNKLKVIEDPAYKANTVWATPKQAWVWETGIDYNGTSPINISGLYINNTFYPGPTGVLNSSYKLDYNNGQVVFDKSVAANSNVTMNYSYRWCRVLKASEFEGRKVLQKLSYKTINSTTETNHSVQLPCLIVEAIPRDRSEAFELGSLVTIRKQDFIVHIYTESDVQRKMFVDILKLQEEKFLKIYDANKVSSSGYYGLNNNGSRNPSGLNYSQIINRNDLVWNTALLRDVTYVDSQQNVSSTLFWCIVRLTAEIIY